MTAENIDERIVRFVRDQLNESARTIKPNTATRLHAARQKALNMRPAPAYELSTQGAGGLHSAFESLLPLARSLVALVGLAIAIAGVSYWNSYNELLETEDIDTALLADELPIDAYLDHGFQAWLDRSRP